MTQQEEMRHAMTASDEVTVVIGTYTDGSPDGSLGIYAAELAGENLTPPRLVATTQNPSWVAVDPSTRLVFGVDETSDHEHFPQGSVSAFRAADDGSLELLNTVGTGGAHPAHLAVTADGTHLVIANYSGSSVALVRIEESGNLVGPVDLAHHAGAGPNLTRQEQAHPHQVLVDPLNGDIVVVDLGIDALVVYNIAEDALHEVSRIEVEAGSGPRHAAFHPDGQHLVVLHELDNSLTVFHRNNNDFRQMSRSSSLAPTLADTEGISAAAIRIAPSGDLVFVSHRGGASNTVGVFRFDPDLHTLTHRQTTSSLGRTPRDIALTPDGTHLLVANQDSNSIEVFSVDYADGELIHKSSANAPSPVCVAFT